MRTAPNAAGLSRKAIMTEIDGSLRRLGTDYVDLYQIHRWDPATPIEETLEALHDVVKAGKARYIGASSMYAWQFAKALFTADLHGWTRFVSMQDHYNLLYREEEREMHGLCADQGIARHSVEPAGQGAADQGLGRRQRPQPDRCAQHQPVLRRRPGDRAAGRPAGGAAWRATRADRAGLDAQQTSRDGAAGRRHQDRSHRRCRRGAGRHPHRRRDRLAGAALHPAADRRGSDDGGRRRDP